MKYLSYHKILTEFIYSGMYLLHYFSQRILDRDFNFKYLNGIEVHPFRMNAPKNITWIEEFLHTSYAWAREVLHSSHPYLFLSDKNIIYIFIERRHEYYLKARYGNFSCGKCVLCKSPVHGSSISQSCGSCVLVSTIWMIIAAKLHLQVQRIQDPWLFSFKNENQSVVTSVSSSLFVVNWIQCIVTETNT